MSKKKEQHQPAQEQGSEARSPHERELEARLPSNLKRDLDRLREHESKILESLSKDEAMKALFLSDPAAALARMGIRVPPLLKQRLKPNQSAPALAHQQEFRLPNGQVVRPRVRITFSGERKQ